MDASSEIAGSSRDYCSDDGIGYPAWPIRDIHDLNVGLELLEFPTDVKS